MKNKISVGTKNKENRDKWIKEALEKIPRGKRILDAGAGELQYKKYCEHLNYVSQDFAQYNGIGNEKGLQKGSWDQSKLDIISEITNISEPENSFDVILCVEVFEHLPEPILAIKEFSRLLRKGGLLILTAPFCSLTHFAPYHFYTGFSRYFYEKFLVDYGFRIVELYENGSYFEYLGQELRRIYSVKKEYTNRNMHVLEKVAIRVVLAILQRFSKRDSCSKELLCFGYHVLAEKTADV